jgi:hypothetical protein
MLSQIVHVHSQHTNTHRPNSNQLTKREGRTPRTRHSRFILMLATCNVYRAHRHGSESPYPRSTLGLNPCNHLAWRACPKGKHDGIGVHIDGTRRRFARHRYGRLIRKGTERIGEGLEVGVLGGEHNDEEQADAAAHAKCLRVRQTCETRKCVAQSKRMDFLFYRLTDANALEFGHILASSCQHAQTKLKPTNQA